VLVINSLLFNGREMAEVSPFEAILGSGAGGPLTAPTPWLSFPGYVAYLAGGVVVGTPSGGNKGPGTVNTQSYYLNGNIVDPTRYLPLVGGVLTGILTLSADPVGTYDAATKRYVDTAITGVNATLGGYLLKTGGTMTGILALSADPTLSLQAATKQYVDNTVANATTAPSWVVGSPTGGNKGTGSTNTQTLYINGTLLNTALYLPFTGGAMTGTLTLSADPVNPLEASTKRYVDNTEAIINGNFAHYLPLTGGTLTGSLTLSGPPTTSLQAATKQYVDTAASGFTMPDAPSDGTIYGRQNAGWTNVQIIDVGTF
jgi:hypothetical protein